jgi:nicotinamidase-related amidase
MSSQEEEFTPQNTAILLIDHQPGVMNWVKSIPIKLVEANIALLAQLAVKMEIPLVVTSTREDEGFLGTNIKTIQENAPKEYANRIKRGGTMNAFADPQFAQAVAATRRKNLVMAGATTDVCLYHATKAALKAGYHVQIAADASGSLSTVADEATFVRLHDMGAVVTSALQILTELYPDFRTPEGSRAEQVAGATLMKAL